MINPFKFISFIFATFISCATFASQSIESIWKHSGKPAWIEVVFDSGIGSATLVRHDNDSKAVGLNIISHIKPVENYTFQWTGKMYSAALNDYVKVKLLLTDSKTLVVFDMPESENSNEILRLFRK